MNNHPIIKTSLPLFQRNARLEHYNVHSSVTHVGFGTYKDQRSWYVSIICDNRTWVSLFTYTDFSQLVLMIPDPQSLILIPSPWLFSRKPQVSHTRARHSRDKCKQNQSVNYQSLRNLETLSAAFLWKCWNGKVKMLQFPGNQLVVIGNEMFCLRQGHK